MKYPAMDWFKRNLRGSPSRDAFKQWHKTLFADLYACDADFVLVNKHPPGIVAVLDYKQPKDSTTFAEVLAYNAFINKGIQVFIVFGEEPFKKFDIHAYLGGDSVPEPPDVNLRFVRTTEGKLEFAQWERELRNNWKKDSSIGSN